MEPEDEVRRKRREKAAAWAASQVATAVQECDQVADRLAADHVKMKWISGGVTLGSRWSSGESEGSNKRQKVQAEASTLEEEPKGNCGRIALLEVKCPRVSFHIAR